MRNTILLLSGLTMLLMLDGCKYPEGPAVSLNTPTARISRGWTLVQATDKDGADVSERFENTYTFTESGDAFAEIEILNIDTDFEGKWSLDNEDTEFDLELVDVLTGLFAYERSYAIQRLTQEEFWLIDLNDSTNIQLQATE